MIIAHGADQLYWNQEIAPEVVRGHLTGDLRQELTAAVRWGNDIDCRAPYGGLSGLPPSAAQETRPDGAAEVPQEATTIEVEANEKGQQIQEQPEREEPAEALAARHDTFSRATLPVAPLAARIRKPETMAAGYRPEKPQNIIINRRLSRQLSVKTGFRLSQQWITKKSIEASRQDDRLHGLPIK